MIVHKLVRTRRAFQFIRSCKSKALPAAIVDLRFQFPRYHRWNPLLQPDVSVKSIISLLIEEKLSSTSHASVRLTVFVKVRSDIEASILVVKEKDTAFANDKEKTCIDAAS